ncbi:helix-turn-helix domain-containing protein, partial [Vibrio sp. M260118]|uniref:helix-turn-helix domain-containing protein n=1 Tax=Vibrio sp. M260118 TaxID=3020896 RepID=UPI002F41D1BB
ARRKAKPAPAAVPSPQIHEPPTQPVINDVATAVAPPPQENLATGNAVTIRPMWQIEREAIQQAIDYCDGNVLNAAVLLELSPSTVYRKKQAWEAEDEQQLV